MVTVFDERGHRQLVISFINHLSLPRITLFIIAIST